MTRVAARRGASNIYIYVRRRARGEGLESLVSLSWDAVKKRACVQRAYNIRDTRATAALVCSSASPPCPVCVPEGAKPASAADAPRCCVAPVEQLRAPTSSDPPTSPVAPSGRPPRVLPSVPVWPGAAAWRYLATSAGNPSPRFKEYRVGGFYTRETFYYTTRAR